MSKQTSIKDDADMIVQATAELFHRRGLNDRHREIVHEIRTAACRISDAASPTPPPTGNRPWERFQAMPQEGSDRYQLIGWIQGDPYPQTVARHLIESHARALADAYNAHRPTPAPDLDAIAREAAEAVMHEHTNPNLDTGVAAAIIREAIEKSMGGRA